MPLQPKKMPTKPGPKEIAEAEARLNEEADLYRIEEDRRAGRIDALERLGDQLVEEPTAPRPELESLVAQCKPMRSIVLRLILAVYRIQLVRDQASPDGQANGHAQLLSLHPLPFHTSPSSSPSLFGLPSIPSSPSSPFPPYPVSFPYRPGQPPIG